MCIIFCIKSWNIYYIIDVILLIYWIRNNMFIIKLYLLMIFLGGWLLLLEVVRIIWVLVFFRVILNIFEEIFGVDGNKIFN